MKKLVLSLAMVFALGVAAASAQVENKQQTKKECCKDKKQECNKDKKDCPSDKAECPKDKKDCPKAKGECPKKDCTKAEKCTPAKKVK